MVACLAPNLRTDGFFITRSTKRKAYGRCRCRAGKKNAFWIKPGRRNGITGPSPRPVFTLFEHREAGGALIFFDFGTGRTTTISTSDKQPGVGLAVSADGKSILYVEVALEDSNIMLVKNFR